MKTPLSQRIITFATGAALIVLLGLVLYVTFVDRQGDYPGSGAETLIHRQIMTFVVTSLVAGMILMVAAVVRPKGRVAEMLEARAKKMMFYAIWAVVGVIALIVMHLLSG